MNDVQKKISNHYLTIRRVRHYPFSIPSKFHSIEFQFLNEKETFVYNFSGNSNLKP